MESDRWGGNKEKDSESFGKGTRAVKGTLGAVGFLNDSCREEEI